MFIPLIRAISSSKINYLNILDIIIELFGKSQIIWRHTNGGLGLSDNLVSVSIFDTQFPDNSIVKIHRILTLNFSMNLFILVKEVHMNKKAYIVSLLTVVFVLSGFNSCLSNQGLNNAHNSKNSLDWQGVYTGTIPSGSGPGIDVRIKLNLDQSFELNYVYIDRPDSQFNWTGSFQWDKKGDIITLDINDAPPHYKVAENKLIQLDVNGKPISGMLADNYVLKKER
jgi:hypothetical protein